MIRISKAPEVDELRFRKKFFIYRKCIELDERDNIEKYYEVILDNVYMVEEYRDIETRPHTKPNMQWVEIYSFYKVPKEILNYESITAQLNGTEVDRDLIIDILYKHSL